ncbi:hypothetical protein [Corynebacterium lowii]|uniref:Uncharacterized protein n=1 Tax=Corynebacterium lowii TaxID=1544413 RepID=A0A0Q0U423_9CORY|nr:hypothetical protein [Corynebacterium lowii]KQB86723.1 hypothetical protein Clow_00931 [Corynebacterium lowii]MDP9851409.1 hypothetical protein [Corynebacterium lowii]
MDTSFKPYPFKAVLAGTITLAPLNGAAAFCVLAPASYLRTTPRLSLGRCAGISFLAGLGGSVFTAVFDRPLVHRYKTHNPSGPVAALNHLVTPALAGGVIAALLGGSRYMRLGALSALVGSLPEFFILKPWKERGNDGADSSIRETMAAARENIEEYKEELRQQHRVKVSAEERERHKHYRPENRSWGPLAED